MAILPFNEDILPPSDDYVLKAVLTHPDAKPALMDLISAVIGRTVSDVQIRNNELPAGDADEKNERLDINCVIQDGSQINVEMQGSKLAGLDGGHDSLINKTVYYLTDLHSSQKSKGVKYSDLVRTYQITFTVHDVFRWHEYVTEASLRTLNGTQISDQINIVIIELNKLDSVLKKNVSEMTPLEMWSAFLGYAADPGQRKLINEVLDTKEAIGMAGTVLAAISKDEHEKAKFMSRRKFETDMTSNMLTAWDEGKKEGKEENTKEMAKKLKDAGLLTVEQIAQISGLSVDEVKAL